ncbi:hypothetical protein [Nannocystis sp.]|uniref:hypothetical protein n=1 Tax=Nannocystis sp. TaxID=1962667 RepID=UPI0025F4FC8E|nr:hypothetical protein [Nannocystis sp.]MBK7829591.1 hypothetical protein [Nannocystis sp.]
METKTIAAAAAGLFLGAGLGATVWWSTRVRRGHVYRVKDHFYADQALVDDLARRLPGARRSGPAPGDARPAHEPGRPSPVVEVFLYQRGKVVFRRVDGEILPAGVALPDQVGAAIYRIEHESGSQDLEDFVVLLVQYGLAESGGAYPSWPTQTRDGITPRPQPLHPTALNPRMADSWSRRPEISAAKTRPRGHYFVVAGDYFADEAMLTSLEWFHGTDFVNDRVVVPAWKRGSIQLTKHSGVHRFPEQEGPLYTITPLLEQVTLEDFLVELEHYNLVSWGGEWPDLETDARTRLMRRQALPMNPDGHAVWVAGELFVDEAALGYMMTRLELDYTTTRLDRGLITFTWRGTTIDVMHVDDKPRFQQQRGKLYSLGANMRARPALESLASALLLHRVIADVQVLSRWPWRGSNGRWHA